MPTLISVSVFQVSQYRLGIDFACNPSLVSETEEADHMLMNRYALRFIGDICNSTRPSQTPLLDLLQKQVVQLTF